MGTARNPTTRSTMRCARTCCATTTSRLPLQRGRTNAPRLRIWADTARRAYRTGHLRVFGRSPSLAMPAPRLLIALVASLAITAGTFGLPSHPLDVAVTRWLQRAAPAPDRPAALFVFLGDAEVLIPAAAAVGLLLWPRDRTAAGSAWALAVGLLATSTMAFLM